MRSLKLLVAAAALVAFVAGPVLAQDATAPSGDTSMSSDAAKTTSTKKSSAKKHTTHKKHTKKSSGSTSTTPAQ